MRLGSYQLEAAIGRGGMGEVWRARVLRRGADGALVAIKVVPTADPSVRAALQAEVAAMARLDHPRICAVYDQGVVSEEDARGSGGRLAAGSPFLVMELGRGSLDRAPLPTDFGAFRETLASILQALAHAHARGLLHRDVKPGNVLLGADGTLRLADFGISRAGDRALESDRERVHGSPPYMPPEQIGGQWRDQGPWTDLYAAACVGWELATGQPPFTGPTAAVLQAHLHREPPPFVARFPAPDGLGELLLALLEKDPSARPARAADAAAALFRLEDPGPGDLDSTPTEEVSPARTTETLHLTSMTVALTGSGPTLDLASLPTEEIPAPRSRAPSTQRPDLPTEAPLAAPRHGAPHAGLGLFGVRTVPLVGRETEQEQLWQALVEAAATGRPRFVALAGGAGSGKSRLARWLCEQAEEIGAATALVAIHSLPAGVGDGLSGTFGRLFRAEGLPLEAATARVQRHLVAQGGEPRDAAVFAACFAPGAARPPMEARHAAMGRLFERVCADRPLVLWLDDVQWGIDSLRIAERLLERALPLVIVATAREDALAERPAEAAALDAFGRRDHAVSIEVGPLDSSATARLLAELAPLDPVLSARVRRRAAGHPLYAVELVGDWVRRGALVPGPSGWSLPSHPPLPEDLHALWGSRVDAVVPVDEAPALELAATLGLTVDVAEWAAAAGLSAAEAHERVGRLSLADLARCGEGRFVFVHGLLRESLVRRAEAAGRLPAHHLAIADALEARGEPPGRVGRHAFAAGAWERAQAPLNAGGSAARRAGSFPEAEELLWLRDRALEALGIPPGDERRLSGRNHISWVRERTGDFDGCTRLAHENLALAEGLDRIVGDASWLVADVYRARGRAVEAWDWFSRANQAMTRADDPTGRSDCERALGCLAGERNDTEVALRHLDAAMAFAERAGDVAAQASTLLVRATWDLQHLRLGEARACVEAAGRRFAEAGYELGVVHARKVGADVAVARGELAEARRVYEEVLDAFTFAGYRHTALTRLQIATIDVREGRYASALGILVEVRAQLREGGGTSGALVAAVLSAQAHAALGDLAAFDLAWADAAAIDAPMTGSDPETARELGRCAAQVAPLDPERAARVLVMQARHRAMLG